MYIHGHFCEVIMTLEDRSRIQEAIDANITAADQIRENKAKEIRNLSSIPLHNSGLERQTYKKMAK